MPELVRRVLSNVRSKLLDLTRRNRLLNYKESVKSIRIVDELPDAVFKIMVNSETRMQFSPVELDDEGKLKNPSVGINELPEGHDNAIEEKHSDTYLQTPFGDSVLERRCKKLLQEAKTAIEETGSNMLYLAIGFLEWYEADDSTEVNRAPLILLPTNIEKSRLDRKSNCYTYLLSYTGEDIETNLSLAEKLKIDFDLILPDLGDCKTPEEYLEAVVNTVSHKKRWRVAREMVLGLFSFSKLLMYRDLDPAHWPTLTEHQNISCILAGREEGDYCDDRPYGEEYDLDRDTKAVNLPLITDADSSQTSVIIDAVHHRENLVVEGPPGTGKSQTITNIIAAALHQGLSILFVAEKKAALEVVRSRLDHAELGDFCLELHSHKTQKGQLHADIGKRLLKKYEDVAVLDRQLEDLSRERDRLMSYSNLVNKVAGPNGETIYEIFWAVERCRTETGGRELHVSVNNAMSLTRNQINDRVNLLMNLARLRLDLPDEALTAFNNFTPQNILPGDEKLLTGLLQELKKQIEGHKTFLCRINDAGCPITVSTKALRRLCGISNISFGDFPVNFHQQLAPILAQPNSMLIIEKLHESIKEFKGLIDRAQAIISACTKDLSYDDNCQIINTAVSLVKLGFGNQHLEDLFEIRDKQERVIALLEQLASLIDQAKTWFAIAPDSISDTERILELGQLFSQIPFDQITPCFQEYTLETTPAVLQEAKMQCTKLAEDIQKHSTFFLLRYASQTEELDSLACGLREFSGSFFAFLSSRYRTLRRRVKNLLVNQQDIKVEDLVVRIENFSDTLKAVNAVVSNQAYVRHLGPDFTGIETNWPRLESHIEWSQKLAKTVGSFQQTNQMIPYLSEVKTSVIAASQAILDIQGKIRELGAAEYLENTSPTSELFEQLKSRSFLFASNIGILQHHQGLRPLAISVIEASARAFLSANGKESEINGDQSAVLLGDYFKGIDTDTEQLLTTARWIGKLRSLQLNNDLIDWMVSGDTIERFDLYKSVLKTNREFWDLYEVCIQKTQQYGAMSEEHPLIGARSDHLLVVLIDSIDALIEHQHSLSTWNDYCVTREKCSNLGLSVITNLISEEIMIPTEASAIYRRAVYESMAREVLQLHPELASFTRAEYEGIRERYARTDRQIMENVRERIAYMTSQRRVPAGIGHGPVKGYTDAALLKRELSKQKRHIPIRQLVRRAGAALQAIKPCFMMSPLSVAQYLDPKKICFDIVIMDEASQLKPEDALGAIARAKQLVVVGDPKQLPPSSFFDRTNGDAADDEEAMAIQDTESILDICMSTYNKRRLRWHYRSAHESLIAFSNSRFYDNDLIIFPSPLGVNCSYGVHAHYIEGAIYQKGRNPLEAEAVALAVVEHFRSNKHNSLGVATFNREQAELVSDILDRFQKEQPWLEQAIKETESSEEPFFIKNLENVQGDERDVIFVSTTYGPDKETGKVFQRFGPIAGKEGWRRLNVIFTRAKKQLELFTSMRAGDIKLGESPSRGTLALKEYLEYAETGRLPDYGITGGKEPDSDFEVSVAYHLHQHGFKTVAQVGVAGFFIDIGVMHPEREGEFVLGIECDGATYHSAKSVRDRDRLRQEILEKKGWRIHRIWSTDWFKNRDKEVQRLIKAVKEVVAEKSSIVVLQDDFRTAVSAAISLVSQSHKQPEKSAPQKKQKKAVKTESPRHELSQQRVASGLREELLEYRLMNILPSFSEDNGKGILRDEILSRLIVHKPTTKDEFYKVVPINMRQQTDGRQMQFIDDILGIIDGYAC